MLATTLLRLLAASLCLSAPAAADNPKLEENNGISLAFVFDSTGSMSDELRQVKEAMQSIFDFMRKHREKEIVNFALVPFNDPGFGPATVTTNANEYRARLNAIVVDGGGDCPELSMHGIKLALEKTHPFSYLFVFTDASAKDHAMKPEIEDLIQSKKSKVVFVLTGMCSGKNDPGYKVYESIADISNGHVFNLLKNEVHQVLDFVKVDTVKKGVVASGILPAGHKTESIPVDSTVGKLTVTATGDKPTIDFTDPTGKPEEGKTTLKLPSVVSKEIPNPMQGDWTVKITSNSPGRFVAAVESSFDFHYGFALNPTHNILETSYRPLAGANNTLLIKITNSTNVSHLTSVVFKDTRKNEFDRRNLIRVPGETNVYVIDGMLIPPNATFLLQVNGMDINNKTLTRTSDSGITPQLLKPPVITLPKDAVAIKGDPLVLKCHVRSLVPFIASWLKDPSVLQDDKHFIQSSEVQLTIENATESSEGTYTCRAENSAGSSSESVYVSLEVKPVLQEFQECEISIATGLRKELPCKLLEGKPPPEITWYRDGEVLEHEELSSVGANVHPNGSLIFSYFKLENEGLYECEAVNSVGKDRTKVFVIGLVPPTIADEDHIVLEVKLNGTVQLPCAAHGDPKPRVSWKMDNLLLQNISSFGRYQGDDSLYIMTVGIQHNGTYQCIASNSVGEAMKTVNVFVRDKPKILPMDEQIHPSIEDEVTLTCDVEAFPEAEIKWLKNGILLDSRDISYSNNTASLRLIADVSSSGKYECLATNEAGKDRAAVDVSLRVAPYFNESSVQNIIARVGDNVSLLCNTVGFPRPTYFWAKYPNNTTEVGDSVLTLYNVQLDQGNIYSCEVQNDEGFAQKYFNLIIYVPPEIKSFPEIRVLKNGSIFELQCLADGNPKPKIMWFKDDKPVQLNFVDSSWLYILGANEDDVGLYTCRAENYEGIDEKHLAIEVEVPPKMALLGPPLLEVNVSESVSLSCPSITANPPPKVQWMKDGLPLLSSRHRELTDGDKTLHLKNVMKRDKGVYTCVATNSLGTAHVNITLEVLHPPHFSRKSSYVSVQQLEGIPINLDCSNRDGYPEPEVLWQRNNHPLPPNILPRVVKSKNKHILTIVSPEITDKGLYKCIVENKAGRIVRSFGVQVLVNGIEEEGFSTEGTWGEWSEWTECSSSCGHSEQVRTRKCSGFGLHCVGEADEWRRCHVSKCKVDGGWGMWGDWSLCSVTCGSGKRIRTRICNNPLPLHGGDFCLGSSSQSEACNIAACPVDGGWTEWSDWTACTGLCPNGTQRRIRKCSNPAPFFGGKPCDGEKVEYRPCIQKLCPVMGGWSEWGSWTTCSVTCGHSLQSRERACTNPKPKFGGDHCAGEPKEMRKCEVEPCDKIPTKAIVRVEGSLNGQIISNAVANISISYTSTQRLISSLLTNIFKNSPWFPYFSIVTSPVTWLTASEKNNASNGFSLTKGVFNQTTFVKFESGEEFVLTHESHGVDSDGVVQLDAHIQGSVPLFSSKVKIRPYTEHYIQTSPGELYASSRTSVGGSGPSKVYTWNTKIKFDPKLGRQMYLSEVLSVHSINSHKRFLSELVSIDKTEDIDCPKGFFLSGKYCQDVDECLDRRTHKCHHTQSCVNAVGSYTCECPSGFTSAFKGNPCEDIDECSQSPDVCSHMCKNLDGSFLCLCPPGMTLHDSNTTCSSNELERKTPDGGECLPQQKEVDGFCQEANTCEDGKPKCGEDEMCLRNRGLYECIPFPCPPGHHRIEGTKSCIMECSVTAPCDSGAEVSQKFVPIIVTLENHARAYEDFISLPVIVDGETARMHTFYRLLENEEGKPFRVKIQNGVGILYSKKTLSPGRKLRVLVLGALYDDHEKHILHAIKFSVLIHTSYE